MSSVLRAGFQTWSTLPETTEIQTNRGCWQHPPRCTNPDPRDCGQVPQNLVSRRSWVAAEFYEAECGMQGALPLTGRVCGILPDLNRLACPAGPVPLPHQADAATRPSRESPGSRRLKSITPRKQRASARALGGRPPADRVAAGLRETVPARSSGRSRSVAAG